MNNIWRVCFIAVVLVAACDKESQKPDELVAPDAAQGATAAEDAAPEQPAAPPADVGDMSVVPLQHASMILEWKDLTIAVDPVKGALDASEGPEPKADIILVTDIHGDHFDADAVAALRKEGGVVVAPQAVVDMAKESLPDPTILGNGDSRSLMDGLVTVEGVAMYNLERKREDSGEPYHVKGRGNGYLLTVGGKRIYISGDTECIPEMKALENIDVAFVCMNLPYTMTVEEAAGCVAEFKPKLLHPYHHRGQEPSKLTELLADSGVEIEFLDWYPASEKSTGD